MTRFLKGTDRPLAEAYQLALLDLDGRGVSRQESGRIRGRFHSCGRSRRHDHRIHHEQLLALPARGGRPAQGLRLGRGAVAGHHLFGGGRRMVAKALPAGARVQVLGAEHLRDEVTRNGLTIVDGPQDRPQAVIQGWYPDMTWQMMADAAFAVEAGATYFVTNRDLTIPRELGIAPGCGSMIRAVITATGVEPVASAGKPEAYMYDEARELNAAEGHDLVPKEASIAIATASTPISRPVTAATTIRWRC